MHFLLAYYRSGQRDRGEPCRKTSWWYEKYAPNDEALEEYQERAQEAELGLWAEDDPIPPWRWRRGERNEEGEGLSPQDWNFGFIAPFKVPLPLEKPPNLEALCN